MGRDDISGYFTTTSHSYPRQRQSSRNTRKHQTPGPPPRALRRAIRQELVAVGNPGSEPVLRYV